MNTAQQADKSPLIQTETMGWEELIDRLIAIQKARNLAPSWVVDRIEETGHPPKQIWRALAKTLNYSQYWADWRHLPGHETDEPDPGTIGWVWELPIPETPPERQTPKPILRNNRP
jgi:hypothetical protein